MLGRSYLASVFVYPCQYNRVHCCPAVFPVMVSKLPRPSLSHVGNFYSLKRYFRKEKKAQAWAAYMVSTYTVGTLENPFLTGGQLSLF
jgi:hypothetical protein